MEAFCGKFQVESRDNFEGFMRGNGVPEEYIEAGKSASVVTEISKSGDAVTIKRIRPKRTTENTFRVGEEVEIDTIKGDKAKVTLQVAGNKFEMKGSDYHVVAEITGGNQLKETFTLKGHTMSRISRKL